MTVVPNVYTPEEIAPTLNLNVFAPSYHINTCTLLFSAQTYAQRVVVIP